MRIAAGSKLAVKFQRDAKVSQTFYFRKKDMLTEDEKILKERDARQATVQSEQDRIAQFHMKNRAANIIQRAYRL